MANTGGSAADRLRKELGALSVFAVGLGATLSSGFFVLPGLAAGTAGPALVVSYLLAVVPLVPAVFSLVELATAMPRAGGAYYFLDRSMGPVVGTIGGLASWLALVFKTAFALVGMGAYVTLFLPSVPMLAVAVGLALLFGGLNLLGAKATASVQVVIVGALVGVLVWFVGDGMTAVSAARFDDLFGAGTGAVIATAGTVYISYGGIMKVASISEEVHDPERNLPIGLFLAVAVAVGVYMLGGVVLVGVLPIARLDGSLTPVADAAAVFAGRTGMIVVSAAALFAFSAVANAGILGASRHPWAMGRDHLLPRFAGQLSAGGIPRVGVLLTVGLIVLCLVALDPLRIAKLGSALLLFTFALVCLAVIIMRESRIAAYDPGYRSPLYPYMQIAGILAPLAMLPQLGWVPVVLMLALITLGVAWYFYYAHTRVVRRGAILHLMARLGSGRYEPLDSELRSILREKGMRAADPFEQVVAEADVLEIVRGVTFEDVTRAVAQRLSAHLPEQADWIAKQFLDGTRVGATPVAHGVALPHFWHHGTEGVRLVMVRAGDGLLVSPGDAAWGEHSPDQPIFALFYLVSPEADPSLHLRILAHIANRVEREGFMQDWLEARGELDLKTLLLREERVLSIHLLHGGPAASWIDRPVRELGLGPGALIAIVQREGRTLVPRGDTVLQAHDRLTLIGEPAVIRELSSLLASRPEQGG